MPSLAESQLWFPLIPIIKLYFDCFASWKKVQHFDFFLPLTGLEKIELVTENEADIKAAEKMGKLYDIIIKDNIGALATKKDFHGFNMFFTRVLFCFFAEDAEIFSSYAWKAE